MRALKSPLIALMALLAVTSAALAQAKLPNRPIRMLVPFAPGGGVDVVARLVGQKLAERLGQPVLIESKPGAGGALAVNELMRADADGTTLLMTTSSHATLPALAKLPWHPSNDFSPIASIYSTMFVMPTNQASTTRFRNLPELLAYARGNPGKVSWGSSGIAGPQHLVGARFMKIAGIETVHVPYRGNAPMLQGLLQNEVQLTFDTPTLVAPHIQDGKLTALAVTGDRRMAKLPEVPTVKDATGLDFTSDIWIFVIGPKGIPEPVQALLNTEIVASLADPGVHDRITGFGLEVMASGDNTVAHLKTHIDDFAAVYGKLITELNIKAE
jgi:tripartite-type tricarboxylate transporter receptor subunit TctC